MYKSVKLWLFIAAIAGLGWLFKDEIFGKPTYSVSQIRVPASNFTAVARGNIDVDGGIVEISARLGGTFREVFVVEGDVVEAGQILAVQEDDEEKISVKNAEASLTNANVALKRLELRKRISLRNIERQKELVAIDASSKQELERMEDDFESLLLDLEGQKASMVQTRNALDSAKFRLEQRTIRAPRAGRIVEAKVRPGMGASTLNVSTAFTLMPDAQRIVRANLDQSFVGQVKVGDKAMISPNSQPGKSYAGKVMRVSEIFGRSSDGGNNGGGGRGGANTIEIVVAAGDVPLLIGQPVMVRFPKEKVAKTKLPSAQLGG